VLPPRCTAQGLQFVQSTMAAVHKQLAGIQASVLRFDRK
jgi:hypothetical protein